MSTVVTVDLLLVLGYFRSATSFLSVIRHLAPDLTIGVLHTDASESLRNKTGDAEALFLRLCREFGAQVLSTNETVEAKLAVIQQFAYDPELAALLDTRVVARRRVGLAGLTFAGLEKHDAFIAQFRLRKAYVPSRRLMTFLLGRREAMQRYADVELEEVGLPFAAYPVFPDFSVDWLIAAPTIFSFSDERDKQAFLRTVLQLLAQIDEADVVAYKPHNGNVLDYFVPRFHYAMASMAERIPGGNRLLSGLAESAPPRLRRHASRTLTSAMHRRVLRRAVPMSTLTPYADISIEAFIPGVRKGVIGGLSNTIWGTLYLQRPYLNCVHRPAGPARRSELVNKSSETLLDLNLEYFGVPFCGGRLSDGAWGESIVLDQDRRGDLVQAIRRDIGDLT